MVNEMVYLIFGRPAAFEHYRENIRHLFEGYFCNYGLYSQLH